MDNGARRARPQWDSGNVAAESGVVHFVKEDAEESGGFVVRVSLELGIDLDDEGGSHSGE